jgi:phosphopantetheine--protein transferase-like protein
MERVILNTVANWNDQMPRVAVHVSPLDEAIITNNLDVLDPSEQAQIRRFLKDADGKLFAFGRIQRRLVLGRYLGTSPARLVFTSSELGKPTLAGPNADRDLVFNTSQSSNFAAIAVAFGRDIAVGVDIERVDRRVTDALAQSCLSEVEYEWFKALSNDRRDTGFIRLWTCKEAIIKASGHGLLIDPRLVVLDPDNLAIRSLPGDLGSSALYRLHAATVFDVIRLSSCLITHSDEITETVVVDDALTNK